MIRKDDQQNLISYLEGLRGENTPIENGAISIVVTLIQLGMLDHILSGGSPDEFSMVAIHQVREYIDRLMEDERLNELMDEAIDNASTEED
jgi:hypothetical protein